MLRGVAQFPLEEDQGNELQISKASVNDTQSQYVDLKFYLKNGYAPMHLNYKTKRALRLNSNQYKLVNDILFRKNYDLVLLRFLEKPEAEKVMQELHDGPARGHFEGNTTAHKILHTGYYWPIIFKDAREYARKCKTCQTASGREINPTFPLQPVNIQQPFKHWGLDIISEIIPNSSKRHRYILIATD